MLTQSQRIPIDILHTLTWCEWWEEWSGDSGNDVEEWEESETDNDSHQEVVVHSGRDVGADGASLEPGRPAKGVSEANLGVSPME